MESVMKEEKHPVPYWNLSEKVQEELEETYGLNWLDYLKSLDQEELDLWLWVSEVKSWREEL